MQDNNLGNYGNQTGGPNPPPTDNKEQKDQPVKDPQSVGMSKGMNVSVAGSSDSAIPEKQPSDVPSDEQSVNRDISVAPEDYPQKIKNFLHKLTEISRRKVDVSFIKQASAATLLSFSLASVVCAGVAFALTMLWPLVVPIAVTVVLSGVLIAYLASSGNNDKNKDSSIATEMLKTFVLDLVPKYSGDRLQQELDKLEQLTESKEFYQQVNLCRKTLENLYSKRLEGVPEFTSVSEEVSNTMIIILDTMFKHMEKDLPEDQKQKFMTAKNEYLLNIKYSSEIKNILKTFLVKNTDAAEELEDKPLLINAIEKGIDDYIKADKKA